MATPNTQYSVRIRAEVENKPGTLGRLTTAIGEAGGSIGALDLVEVIGDHIMVRDITVLAVDEGHVEAIRAVVEGVEGVHVRDVADRTFLMHMGGKIEVRSKIPLTNRDDLSMAYTPGVARVCNAIAKDPDEVHAFT